MKLKLALVLSILFSNMVLAGNTASYCLTGKLVNIKYKTPKSTMKCNVAQKLTWNDYSVLFQCNFGGKKADLFTIASTLGSNLGYSAWTNYSLTGGELGKFLSSGLKLNQIKKAQPIKIMYTHKVWAKDDFIVVEDAKGVYKLHLEAQLGKCRYF